jgi:hypothetical protein
MRIIMLAVLAAGAFWAYDSYEYEGRYSRELWRQVATDGQYFSDQVQRLIKGPCQVTDWEGTKDNSVPILAADAACRVNIAAGFTPRTAG